MNVKDKFHSRQNRENFHFCEILHGYSTIWKYASFEGSEISRSPWFYRDLGLKKASLKDAILVNSRIGKGVILVQNVKNQFFHELSWRGIWVV